MCTGKIPRSKDLSRISMWVQLAVQDSFNCMNGAKIYEDTYGSFITVGDAFSPKTCSQMF